MLAALASGAAAAEKSITADHAAKMAASQELFRAIGSSVVGEELLGVSRWGEDPVGFNLSSRELLLKGGDKGPARPFCRDTERTVLS